ncbi:HEAT repeat domain-containing protein [bacterium]|nr:HEAT repeat domain-containing protein [bacterium]
MGWLTVHAGILFLFCAPAWGAAIGPRPPHVTFNPTEVVDTWKPLFDQLKAIPHSFCVRPKETDEDVEEVPQSLHSTEVPRFRSVLDATPRLYDDVNLFYGAPAKQLLDEAVDEGNLEKLDAIAYQFPYTHAAFVAAYLTALGLADYGLPQLGLLYFAKAREYTSNREELESIALHEKDFQTQIEVRKLPPVSETYLGAESERHYVWNLRAMRLLGPQRFAQLAAIDPGALKVECLVYNLEFFGEARPTMMGYRYSALADWQISAFELVGKDTFQRRLAAYRLVEGIDQLKNKVQRARRLAALPLIVDSGFAAKEGEYFAHLWNDKPKLSEPESRRMMLYLLSNVNKPTPAAVAIYKESLKSVDPAERLLAVIGIRHTEMPPENRLPLLKDALERELALADGYYPDRTTINRILEQLFSGLGSLGPAALPAVPLMVSADARMASAGATVRAKLALLEVQPDHPSILPQLTAWAVSHEAGHVASSVYGALSIEQRDEFLHELGQHLLQKEQSSRYALEWIQESGSSSRGVVRNLVALFEERARKCDPQRYFDWAINKRGMGDEFGHSAGDWISKDLETIRIALSKHSPRLVIPALVPLLESPFERLKAHSAEVLGRFGPQAKEAVEPLKRLLDDKAVSVQLEAGMALVKIDPRAHQRAVFDKFEEVLLADKEAVLPWNTLFGRIAYLGAEDAVLREATLKFLMSLEENPNFSMYQRKRVERIRKSRTSTSSLR